MADPRFIALLVLTVVLLGSTTFSVLNHTYMDTSDPRTSGVPHPLHLTHYFASKQNILNVKFIKRAWGWTSGAFITLWITSPIPSRTEGRITKWLVASASWLLFTAWFFGPSVFQRLQTWSGAECMMRVPGMDELVVIPAAACYLGEPLSPTSHPEYFTTIASTFTQQKFRVLPRLYKGHDVSGHVFLLTLSTLFLADDLRHSLRMAWWPPRHKLAVANVLFIMGVWVLGTLTTGVYFHTPDEKISGFALGLLAWAMTQLPIDYLHDTTPVSDVFGNAPRQPQPEAQPQAVNVRPHQD